ncbi:MAG: hypothetical protein HYZ81_25795 [Nitrospinae bacterium]|nr:hypothetical protein [Nitrospinota bacterium]
MLRAPHDKRDRDFRRTVLATGFEGLSKGAAMKEGAALHYVVRSGIVATVFISIGSLWDTLIHITRGHWLLAPAHLVILTAALLFTVGGGAALFFMRRVDDTTCRALRVVVAGSVLVLVSLTVLDEVWHVFFGLDTTGWSPPHLLFWLGMLIELFGLVVLSRISLRGNARRPSSFWPQGELILICAAILVILLFNCLEYDVPAAAVIADERPPFTYTVAGTFLFMTGLLVVMAAIMQPWTVTIAAVIAWLFFGMTGVVIELLSGVSYVVFPFPIVIPALALDLWIVIVWRNQIPLRCHAFLSAALVVGAVCYWSMIAWAAYVMGLPHQLSGTSLDWIRWFFMFIPALSFLAGYSAWQLASRFMSVGMTAPSPIRSLAESG